ncbi:hypothetical protein CONLIGDRAFT_161352 [Coniochaeta ligniaria NRRL 30616]|uniref:Uncharacterized protein n=1 Tax=Coniochaeta ligniaria NRRL 30616 TaxID=1408157 RepID=A0A1J7IZV7_9PEZI|nr:hypothetical protein CONLIGDRAFT_161352 [Coniochaeta ligniaria NRRL 30616]
MPLTPRSQLVICFFSSSTLLVSLYRRQRTKYPLLLTSISETLTSSRFPYHDTITNLTFLPQGKTSPNTQTQQPPPDNMGPSRADKRADPLYYLPPTSLQTFAWILCYLSPSGTTQPTKDWLVQQKSRISDLPRTLKLHRSVSLATFFSIDEVVSARLCTYHRELKPELVFWCYTQLNEEVSTHLDRYRRYRAKFAGECTDELRDYIDRVTSIATLYLHRDDFEGEYGRHALKEEGERHERVRGGCAACVLAVVGARAQMLIDLRASMLARAKRKTPRLLLLVEAWMDAFPSGTVDMRRESEEIAQALTEFRERIAEVRGEEGDGRESHYEVRDKRRRRKKQHKVSMSKAIADFLGWKFGDKKKLHGSSSGSHHRSSSRRASSPHRPSSSRHGSSTHREPSLRREASSRAGSTYSSSSRPGSSSGRPQSEYIDRHSARPSSSASRVQAWDDGRTSRAGHDEDNRPRSSRVSSYTEDVPDDATLRGSRHGPSSDGGSGAGFDSRYSRNPYRMSFPQSLRPESVASAKTIRPEYTPGRPASHASTPVPDSYRNSWTSSVYSTDDAGFRPGDGYRNTADLKPLQAVIEGLELEEDDVPLDPAGYDEVCCPSSDSEDGGNDNDDKDEKEEVEQYVPARANWPKKPAVPSDDSSTEKCPLCQGSLAGLTPVQRNAHCNACIDGKAAPLPSSSSSHGGGGGRPTVSGIGRMVDDVIDGFGRMSTIDEAAEQFTPRSSVASRIRREYQGEDDVRSHHRASSVYAPSSVGAGVRDDEVGPDDSISVAGSVRPSRRRPGSVAGSTASRRSALGGGKFRNVVRDR